MIFSTPLCVSYLKINKLFSDLLLFLTIVGKVELIFKRSKCDVTAQVCAEISVVKIYLCKLIIMSLNFMLTNLTKFIFNNHPNILYKLCDYKIFRQNYHSLLIYNL